MTTLWDLMPPKGRRWPPIAALQPLLDASDSSVDNNLSDATWDVWGANTTMSGSSRLIDLSTGRFVDSLRPDATGVEFGGAGAAIAFRLWKPTDSAADDLRLDIEPERVAIRVGPLRGAMIDNNRLVHDPSHDIVRVHLPALPIRLECIDDAGWSASLVAEGGASDDVFVEMNMEPDYALLRTTDEIGFGELGFTLDASQVLSPPGRDQTWQGIHIPRMRLFGRIAEDWYVSIGVEDVAYGFAPTPGFEGEASLSVEFDGPANEELHVRFRTPAGSWIWVRRNELEADAGTTPPPVEISVPHRSVLVVDGATIDQATGSAQQYRIDFPTTSRPVEIGLSLPDGSSRRLLVSERPTTGTRDGAATPTVQVEGDEWFSAVIDSVTDDHVILRFTDWLRQPLDDLSTVDGRFGERLQVDVPPGERRRVTVFPDSYGVPVLPVYFTFDEPRFDLDPTELEAFVESRRRVWLREAPDGSTTGLEPFAAASDNVTTWRSLAASGHDWNVVGYASDEGRATVPADRNDRLSQRRAETLAALIADAGGSVASVKGIGTPNKTASTEPTSSKHWSAVAYRTLTPSDTVTFDIVRPAGAVAETSTPTVTNRRSNNTFRSLRIEVELRPDIVRILFEIGVNLGEELERLPLDDGQGSRNVDTLILGWEITNRGDTGPGVIEGWVASAADDQDGLLDWTADSEQDRWLSGVGGLVAALPLLAETDTLISGNPTAQNLNTVTGAVGFAALGAFALNVRRLIIRRATLKLLVDPVGADVLTILGDVEVAFGADIELVKIDSNRPAVLKYSAGGIALQFADDAVTVTPIVDRSAGFDFDLPSGSLSVTEELGDIIRFFGGRPKTHNPMQIEGDLELAVELGPLSVDRARVSFNLIDPEGSFEVTGMGATLAIPEVLTAEGSVDIDTDVITGRLDLILHPFDLRGGASVTIDSRHDAVGVLIDAFLNFSPPLTLGSTGLGIFGFTGGLAINYERTEATPSADETEPLAWFRDRLATSPSRLMVPEGWTPSPGQGAFSGGVLLGTVEGGFILNLHGVVLIESAGPRISFATKADLLATLPILDKPVKAALIAAITFSPNEASIAIAVNVDFDPILTFRANIVAEFNGGTDWRVDIGSFQDPIRATVLGSDVARGYLMARGDGVTAAETPAYVKHDIAGLVLAAGFAVEIELGVRQARIYLAGWAGFDALVSFEPVGFAGDARVGAEIVILFASFSVEGTIQIVELDGHEPYLSARFCAALDLFFFEIKACLGFATDDGPPKPEAPDLIARIDAVAQPSVPLHGMAADTPIDASIGRLDADSPVVDVPIDAVVTIQLTATPELAPNAVLNRTPTATSPATSEARSPWAHRGTWWFAYRIDRIQLTNEDTGETISAPSAWRRPPNGDAVAIALLTSWPELTDARPFSEALVDDLTAWNWLCQQVQPAAELLFVFDEETDSAGPWNLDGVAGNAPFGSFRSSTPRHRLAVASEAPPGALATPAMLSTATTQCDDYWDRGMSNSRMVHGPRVGGAGSPNHQGTRRPDRLADTSRTAEQRPVSQLCTPRCRLPARHRATFVPRRVRCDRPRPTLIADGSAERRPAVQRGLRRRGSPSHRQV